MSSRLDPEDVDLIARRVLALLRTNGESPPARLVDARTLADLLGVTRAWVYAHAQELHAVRLGGPRGRLRFDLNRVLSAPGATAHAAYTQSRPGSKVPRQGAKLLPIEP